jgi:hypothetical protein
MRTIVLFDPTPTISWLRLTAICHAGQGQDSQEYTDKGKAATKCWHISNQFEGAWKHVAIQLFNEQHNTQTNDSIKSQEKTVARREHASPAHTA